MRVMVTGGAGFIGSHIVDRLIELNHDVCIVDDLSTGKEENINKGARFYKYDITNLDAMRIIFNFEKPDILIHNAAQISVQTSLRKPGIDADSNILGTINMLQCCIEYEVKKIIYPSSAAVYGEPLYLPIDEEHPVQPISFYGISKHTPEHYIKAYSSLYGLKYTIFRYANVYGPRQDAKGEGGVVSIFIDKIYNNESPVIFGDGDQTRDFVYVKDVAEANILALKAGDNQIINISTNIAITVNELYKIMKELSKSSVVVQYKTPREGDVLYSYLKNEKAAKYLKWNPKFKIESGLEKTINYYHGIESQVEVAAGFE